MYETTTTTTTKIRDASSSLNAPSKNANYETTPKMKNRSPHANTNFHEDNSVCDETWPLDEVINKIELKSDSDDDHEQLSQPYNVETSVWRSGPQLVTEHVNSNRDVIRIPGGGQMFSTFQQGSKIWKDSSVKHRKYKTKKQQPDVSSNSFDMSLQKNYLPYGMYRILWDNNLIITNLDVNNNYVHIYEDDYSNQYEEDEYDEDSTTLLLRDVGIQCNLKRYDVSSINSIPNESTNVKKPSVKVIKSMTNGMVSTFSDVPKLSSTTSNITHIETTLDDLKQPTTTTTTIKGNDAIYSQVDKNYKTRKNLNTNNNINIIYKHPLNDSFINDPVDNRYEVKVKERGFNIGNPSFTGIHLPDPNESKLREFATATSSSRNKNREVLEETISISNCSTDESSLKAPPSKTITTTLLTKPPYDNNSVTSKESRTHFRKESSSPLRVYPQSGKDSIQRNKMTSRHLFENDENVLLENNSLRLKSSKKSSYHPQPHEPRLHKSNADLREQFIRDETRGGLAAAYKNRQQQQKNRQRTLSLNRMNAMAKEDQLPATVTTSRYLSQSHLSDLNRSDAGNGVYHGRSKSIQHERDPIVMYIPPVSSRYDHSQRSINDNTKLTSILRNNSSKSNLTLQSKAKKYKQPKSQSKVNLKEISTNKDGTTNISSSNKKGSDLNRRYSMPKDTKFNWLSRLKLKPK